MKRNFITFGLFALVAVFAYPTSGQDVGQEYQLKLVKRFYSIATASIDGVYYPLGTAISRLLNTRLDRAVFIPEPTGGSVTNVEHLRSGDVSLALVQSDIAFDAFHGQGSFEGRPLKELRVLASLYSEVVHIVTAKDTDIFTVDDLRGKRIALGGKGSGTEKNAIRILEVLGLSTGDYLAYNESFTKATDALQNGLVDVVFFTGGLPSTGITNLSERFPIKFVPFSRDLRDRLVQNYPSWREEVIPAATYSSQDGDITTVGLRALLATTSQFDPELSVTILKLMFENVDYLSSISSAAGNIKLLDGLRGIEDQMLHEGARGFYKSRGIIGN